LTWLASLINAILRELGLRKFKQGKIPPITDSNPTGEEPIPDTTPDGFTFTDVSAPTGTLQASNTITISGLGLGIAVTALVTPPGELQKNSFPWTNAGVTVVNGDALTVRVTAPNSTTLNVGGVTDTFTVTAAAATGGLQFNQAANSGLLLLLEDI
jgi:hypothetical protein